MADTVKIKIPPVALTISGDDGSKLDWTLPRCVQWIVDTHPRFNQTGPGIRQGARIIAGFGEDEQAPESGPILREDCAALSAAMDEPPAGFHPPLTAPDGKPSNIPARLFIPYLDAVAEALKKE